MGDGVDQEITSLFLDTEGERMSRARQKSTF
jgi:hypothetical protein